MLEERITQEYMDGPWSKSTHYLSDDEGSDIVDMSEAPPGIKNQDDWVFEEGSPTFNPVSPSNEPLDWGSDEDLEECVHLPFLWPHTYKHTVSPQLPKRRKSWTAGNCSVAYPSMTLGTTMCEHSELLARCEKCKHRYTGKLGDL